MARDFERVYPPFPPGGHVMMECVSAETEARLTKAARTYARLRVQMKDARDELVDAIVAERREGTLIEDITERVPYRQTQVNRILEAAGLTEKRTTRRETA